MKITVTAGNLQEFNAYTGTEKPLEIGQELTVIENKVPCVTHRKGSGRATTFSIVTDGELSQNSINQIKRTDTDTTREFYDEVTADGGTWQLNRWSINNAFVPTKIRQAKIESKVVQ